MPLEEQSGHPNRQALLYLITNPAPIPLRIGDNNITMVQNTNTESFCLIAAYALES